jgi:MoaA/NifB/PqqE/SkfB family radical SAM enzyme
MNIIPSENIFETYGEWNVLLAKSSTSERMSLIPAHDGDFFPETPFDYIEALKNIIRNDSLADENLSFAPIRVDIDITQSCNANCTFCFSRRYQKGDYRGAIAKMDELDRLLAELSRLGTRTIRYCGGGECLSHPNIKELLPLPHKYGMRLGIITNGDLIDEDLAYQIYENVDHLRWSVNASSEETRIRIHRPKPGSNQFSKTLELIRTIERTRHSRFPYQRRPIIGATFLVLPDNAHEIISAGKILKDVGVDSVSFRPVFKGLGGQWPSEMLANLDQIFGEVRTLAEPPRFLVFTPKRNIREAANLIPSDHFSACVSRRLRTVFEATTEGLLLQSCGMYRGTGTRPGLVFKPNYGFSHIWNHAQNYPSVDCPSCIDVSMNKTLNSIMTVLYNDPNAKFYLGAC